MHRPEEVTDVIRALRPNRAARRKFAGASCSLCGLGIVARDFALVIFERLGVEQDPNPIHQQCTSLLADIADDLRNQPDDE